MRLWLWSVFSRFVFHLGSKLSFSRQVHARVRRSTFESRFNIKGSGSFKESSAGKMGNCLGIQFNKLKLRVKGLKYFHRYNESFVEKAKEHLVIDIDDADDEGRRDLSNDSTIEEVEEDLQSLDSSVVTDAQIDGVDLIQLDEEQDDSLVTAHKKYDFTKRRDGKLSSLDEEIEYNKNLLERVRLLQSEEKDEQIKKDRVEEAFLPLSKEEEHLVNLALSNINKRKVLVSHENSNIDIIGEKLQCLRPGTWLNDEVVNLYLALLKERENRQPQKFLKCHFFNTFFYKKLTGGRGGYDFQSVRRWTTKRKLGYSLLDCEKIFVPIHEEIHWTLGIINKKEKKFQYLDSLKGVDSRALDVLAKYYVDEVKDKNGEDIDVSLWEKEFVRDLPDQHNMFDCGMFMVKYTDFYSRDIGLCFNQGDMPYFRRRIVKEILQLRAD